jgi:hypothetical protein
MATIIPRICSLTGRGIKGFDGTITLTGLDALIGANGTNKTAVLQTLRLGMYGCLPESSRSGGVVKRSADILHLLSDGGKPIYIRLEADLVQGHRVVEWDFHYEEDPKTNELKAPDGACTISGGKRTITGKAARTELVELFGDPGILDGNEFVRLSDDKRKDVIFGLIPGSPWTDEDLWKKAGALTDSKDQPAPVTPERLAALWARPEAVKLNEQQPTNSLCCTAWPVADQPGASMSTWLGDNAAFAKLLANADAARGREKAAAVADLERQLAEGEQLDSNAVAERKAAHKAAGEAKEQTRSAYAAQIEAAKAEIAEIERQQQEAGEAAEQLERVRAELAALEQRAAGSRAAEIQAAIDVLIADAGWGEPVPGSLQEARSIVEQWQAEVARKEQAHKQANQTESDAQAAKDEAGEELQLARTAANKAELDASRAVMTAKDAARNWLAAAERETGAAVAKAEAEHTQAAEALGKIRLASEAVGWGKCCCPTCTRELEDATALISVLELAEKQTAEALAAAQEQARKATADATCRGDALVCSARAKVRKEQEAATQQTATAVQAQRDAVVAAQVATQRTAAASTALDAARAGLRTAEQALQASELRLEQLRSDLVAEQAGNPEILFSVAALRQQASDLEQRAREPEAAVTLPDKRFDLRQLGEQRDAAVAGKAADEEKALLAWGAGQRRLESQQTLGNFRADLAELDETLKESKAIAAALGSKGLQGLMLRESTGPFEAGVNEILTPGRGRFAIHYTDPKGNEVFQMGVELPNGSFAYIEDGSVNGGLKTELRPGIKKGLALLSNAPFILLDIDELEAIYGPDGSRGAFLRHLAQLQKEGTVHQVIVAGCPDTLDGAEGYALHRMGGAAPTKKATCMECGNCEVAEDGVGYTHICLIAGEDCNAVAGTERCAFVEIVAAHPCPKRGGKQCVAAKGDCFSCTAVRSVDSAALAESPADDAGGWGAGAEA